MAKRSHRSLSKKGFPGLRRYTNSEGVRMWRYGEEDYATLREVVMKFGKR